MTTGHTFWPVTRVTRDPRLLTSHDSRLLQFPVRTPLSGSALNIKHHHCHKILRRNNWIKLTLWLRLCRKSAVVGILLTWSWVNGSRVLTRDPLTHCHLWAPESAARWFRRKTEAAGTHEDPLLDYRLTPCRISQRQAPCRRQPARSALITVCSVAPPTPRDVTMTSRRFSAVAVATASAAAADDGKAGLCGSRGGSAAGVMRGQWISTTNDVMAPIRKQMTPTDITW